VLLGHHVFVGAFSTVNPGANIGGNTTMGGDTFIGMGATVVNGVRIGDGAVVAAGAVVLEDVESGARVQGVPARELSAYPT
jgi:UDP-perosamine 4-acetyltransferase